MKFPSIFKVSQPNRFNITPRHYDPVKEEISDRTERIRRELQQEGILQSDEEINDEYRSRSTIRGAFTKGGPIKRQPSNIFASAGIIRLIIMVILIGGFAGYIYIGPIVLTYMLYTGLGISALLVLLKLKS